MGNTNEKRNYDVLIVSISLFCTPLAITYMQFWNTFGNEFQGTQISCKYLKCT